MRTYVVSLAVGVLVGIIYGLLDVRSPAPPVVALIGLLGMPDGFIKRVSAMIEG